MMRFGFTLQALSRKRSVLPLRGGSMMTASSFSPLSATRSKKSLASSAKKRIFSMPFRFAFAIASRTAALLSSTPITCPALREAAMPMVPTPQ